MLTPGTISLGHPLAQALLAVVNDQQRQLAHLVKPGPTRGKGSLDVGQRLTRLLGEARRQSARSIFTPLPGNEQQPATGATSATWE